MIAYLSGKVLEKRLDSIVLNVSGVGYFVFVTNKVVQKAAEGEDLSIHTYLAVRETALDLYGFEDSAEKEMFELLLTISGIGPKSAMSIMSSSPVETLVDGIQSGDAAYLAKMSGIGKKSAEKIVLGLKDKIGSTNFAEAGKEGGAANESGTAIDALVALGYSERESREVIQKTIKTLDSAEDKNNPEVIIKEALKNLGQ
jgi:Holliday junction DNA helicase RuvA